MPLAFKLYTLFWLLACVAAAILMYRQKATLELFQRPYWRMLLVRWKLVTFLLSATPMIIMAPYTGDPTWDYVDAAFMSILAFATAPWVLGTLYLAFRGSREWQIIYIALCVWMFSVSWSYDGYILLRDGTYPFTWLPNIFASSVLYVCAGLFWSLEWKEKRGVHFSFTETGWPQPYRDSAFSRIVWFALPFMLLVSAMILPFLF